MGGSNPAGKGRLRFGCHDFLNSQPLIRPLLNGTVEPPFEIVLDSPARLADMLKEGGLDLAFIPAVEYASIPGLRIVPGFSIAARGDVKTVLMHSKKPVGEISSVAADERSRTSVALLKLLFRGFFKRDVAFVAAGEPADAVLVIGDDAFSVSRAERVVYDLAGEWLAFTGKPFVFSVLCVADGVNADEAITALKKSKEIGVKMTDEICGAKGIPAAIGREVCEDYVRRRIRYDLAPADVEGLKLFFQLARRHGVIEREPPLRFYP
ncbi:MAG: menaquinone biosynthesis protein [Nitrospinae bacterium]|nr:menaquinone biosynthesis protein [Nitrospinota bacterium]